MVLQEATSYSYLNLVQTTFCKEAPFHSLGFEVDIEKRSGKYLRLPERSELNQEINEQLIVEYYNRLG